MTRNNEVCTNISSALFLHLGFHILRASPSDPTGALQSAPGPRWGRRTTMISMFQIVRNL